MQTSGYEAARPTHRCAATGKPLSPGQRFVATLAEHEQTGEIVRWDFSLDAWASGQRTPVVEADDEQTADPHAYRIFAIWKSTEQEKDAKPSLLIGSGELFELFESMEDAQEGKPAVFRYLLALLLMRKRTLRLVDQQVNPSGRPVLCLVRRGEKSKLPKGVEPKIHKVIDPGMDEQAIAAGIEQLGSVLAADLESQDGAS